MIGWAREDGIPGPAEVEGPTEVEGPGGMSATMEVSSVKGSSATGSLD